MAFIAVAMLIALVACTSMPVSPAVPGTAAEPPPETIAEPPAPEETPILEPVRPTLLEQVPRISIEELLVKMDSNANIVVVDTRQEDQYSVDHIKGAVSAPLTTIVAGEWVPPVDKEIILYCG